MTIGTVLESGNIFPASSTGVTPTYPSAGTAIVVAFGAAASTGCSDPTNGTYTQCEAIASSSRFLSAYTASVVAGSPLVTVTCGSANLIGIGVLYVVPGTLDVHGSVDNAFLGTSGASNAILGATSSLTTTGADTVVSIYVNDATVNGTGAVSIGAGQTQLTTAFEPNNTNPWLWQYIVQGSAGAINPPAFVNGQCDVLAITIAIGPGSTPNVASIAWVT
jgi:hypothetical protein